MTKVATSLYMTSLSIAQVPLNQTLLPCLDISIKQAKGKETSIPSCYCTNFITCYYLFAYINVSLSFYLYRHQVLLLLYLPIVNFLLISMVKIPNNEMSFSRTPIYIYIYINCQYSILFEIVHASIAYWYDIHVLDQYIYMYNVIIKLLFSSFFSLCAFLDFEFATIIKFQFLCYLYFLVYP